MTHISKKSVDGKILEKIYDFLVIALTDIKNKGEMRAFLDSLITPTEKIMLAKRLAIVYLISENVSLGKISEMLAVTPSTICKIKVWLKIEGAGYSNAMEKIKKSENFTAIKTILWETFDELTKSPARRIKEMKRID